MTTDPGDPGCRAALSAAVGHAPPFQDAELSALQELVVTHARDIKPLAACTGLKRLRFVACELSNIQALKKMPLLEHLEVYATKLESLGGASYCERLERVDVVYSSLDDCADLLGIESWNRGTVIANHCSEIGWRALVEDADAGRNLGELSDEYDWTVTQQLWGRGEACVGYVGRGHSFVVRPGLPQLTANVFDALRLMPSSVAHELRQPGFTLAKLFAERAKRIEVPDLVALANARTLGKTDAALGWIAQSSLPAEERDLLGRFVRRFPKLVFYRWNGDNVDTSMPAWYRTLQTTLDGWMPHRVSTVKFDAFESWSPRGDRVSSIPYSLGPREHGNDGSKELLEKAGFAIIGLSEDGVTSTLALRTDGIDRRIYEYCHEDILDAMAERKDVARSIQPVFKSYAAMLSHIALVQPATLAPIAAVNP